jgi:imidazolonepropionase-like amidohydrolase
MAIPYEQVALDMAREALDACEDYFDSRQDADCDQDGFIPNEEMRLLHQVSKALNYIDRVRSSSNVER